MAQQTPYIGSKISLISKLDIRYEGILYTVDTNESTIALAKVQSFGTEDRPTANPVAGRDDIYEYIIFKASDIKDLIVCDTPKPVPQLGGLAYDPAILSVSQGHTIPQSSIPQIPPTQGVASVTSIPTLANPISAGTSGSTTPNRISPTNEGIAPLSRAPGAGRSQARSSAFTAQAPHFEGPKNRGFTQQSPQAAAIARPIPQSAAVQQSNQYKGNAAGNSSYSRPTPSYRGGSGGGGVQRGTSYSRGGGGSYQRGGQRMQPGNKTGPTPKMKFDSDYDFEKANEQFQETLNHITKDLKKSKIEGESGSEKASENSDDVPDVVEEVENGATERDETFYDRSSSFFDRISCESLEKEAGKQTRPDWRKERETNQETFGHQAVRSLAYRRGRAFMGPRGERGMYRYNSGYGGYGGQHRGYSDHHYGYRRGGYRNNFMNQ